MADVTAKIYNVEGKEVGQEKLPSQLFAVGIKPEVVQQAVVAQQANARVALGHTKTRGEVRGGGRKPWKQKGTGRARHGSIRSPIWVGGGITFGPRKERTFGQRLNKKVKQKALQMVLSDKAAHQRIIIMDKLELPETKTKTLQRILSKLPGGGRRTIIITDASGASVVRAARNLAATKTISVKSLNTLDILKHEYIVMPQALIKIMVEIYS